VFTGVNPVFTPILNTVKEDEMVNIIEYSSDEPEGVKVLSENPGGEGKNFEKAQEGPGNGHGNGEGVDLDEYTKNLAEEFSVLMNPQNLSKMTPHVCRKGCKHYDPIGDPEGGNFREFCGKSNGTLIERGSVCENYKSKRSGLSEGVLTF
jgi:hypothetical protein